MSSVIFQNKADFGHFVPHLNLYDSHFSLFEYPFGCLVLSVKPHVLISYIIIVLFSLIVGYLFLLTGFALYFLISFNIFMSIPHRLWFLFSLIWIFFQSCFIYIYILYIFLTFLSFFWILHVIWWFCVHFVLLCVSLFKLWGHMGDILQVWWNP